MELSRPSNSRVVLHVDLDYFFAQVEERENPVLHGKPVVVCVYSGRGPDSGAVSTANYIARKYGVKSGMPILFAKRILKNKEAIFLPVRHELYEMVSESIMRILRTYADKFEQAGVDEAYLDVTERVKHDFDLASELASQIKNTIKTTEKLTCSIGIGPNKLIAKIASDHNKPDGLTVVKPEEAQSFISSLPVGKLYGIGRKTEKKLLDLEIKTIGELAKLPLQELTTLFGKTFGTYLYYASRGIDNSQVEEKGPVESYSRMVTLKQDTRDISILLDEAYLLCEELHKRLTQHEYTFRNVSVTAVMKDMSVHSRSKSVEPPTNSLEVMKENVKELLNRLLKDIQLEIRRLGIRIAGFQHTSTSQRSLTEFIDKHF